MQKRPLTQSTKISRVVPRSYDFAIQKEIRKSTKCLAHRNSSEQVYLEGTAYRSYPTPCRGVTKLFLNNRAFSSTKGKPQVWDREASERIEKTKRSKNQSAEKTPLLNVPFWRRKIPTLSAKVFSLIHGLIGNSQKTP